MEIPESDRRKLQQQPPGVPIPTTTFNPIVPMPVPIWTPEMGNQLYSHFNGIPAGFHVSPCPDINNWPFHRSETAAFAHHNAQTAPQISFEVPSSSNGIAELFAQPDIPFAYSNVTNEELLSQFIPPYNLPCNPSYASFDHHQLSLEQPLANTIHNQYQGLLGSSYFDYCSKTFPQIAPQKDDAVAAEPRKDAAAPTIIKERNHERDDKNAPAKYDPNRETAASSAPRKENYNHKMEVSLDFDLNKTPQPKAKRRKHRPKVIKEDKPKRATKKVQSKENQTDKKKARKGLNTTSTPQTEVTREWTTPLTPESVTKTCRRSLNFNTREQARDGNSRHKETMLFAKASSSRNWMANYNGLQECAQILSKPVAQSSSNNSNRRDCLSTGCGLQAVGSKRKQPGIEQADNGNINLIGAQYNAMQSYCLDYGVQFPNVQKKRRTENGRIPKTPRKSSVTDLKDVRLATFVSHPYVSSHNCWYSGSEYNAAGLPERAIHDKHQPLECTLSLGQKRPTKRRSKTHAGPAHTRKQTCSSDRRTFGDPEGPQTCTDALIADLRGSVTKKKRTEKRRSLVRSSSCKNERQHNTLVKWKNIQTQADLIEQFRFLNIDGEIELHGQNMLVPYNQQNGTIVPYEAQKKKKRPKVDLDGETERVWNLLLLDINSSGIDGTDPDTVKWWKEEREVFRGRADSFIARMHLVQGDRRFSMWKGSVVDSVVGVFLTQNVSDHLSSSAFMSLAARYPLKSTSTFQKESTCSMVNEPQVCIVEPVENGNQDRKILDQSICQMNSKTMDIIENSEEREGVDCNVSCRTNGGVICVADESNSNMLESAQRRDSEHSPVESGTISGMTEEGQESLCHVSVRKELNNVFPSQLSGATSQTSGDFSIDQNTEKIGSFSDSNSEIEDLSSTAQFNIYHSRTSFRELLEMASSTMLHEVNSQGDKSTENFRDTCDQSIDLNHDNQVGNLEKSGVTLTQDTFETPITKEYALEATPNSGVLEVNYYDPLKIEVPSSDSSKNKGENDKRHSFRTDSNSKAAFVNSHGQTQDPMQKARDQKLGDHKNEKKKNGKKNSKKESAPKKTAPKKLKSEKHKEEENNFDWDSLRIQAQARAGKREKTENTMDSADWDAVRRADLSEISEIIRERGMNNLLADRIKGFLNRIFDKHGDLDLEWLRDVPPDQAKEFLLSINGLGLKSVECVRLLTLHHLAFPVDTNVGRIAVRLGWVPLRPLPESLQLHLLELYPVLESVQKYLWPRLCKLDQRTLYELHYQLITFGKVFCTKNKPNCNACPMRGECKHFASAFASARLALPGPEEKRIVIPSGNNANEQNTPLVINQPPLFLPGNTIQDELQQTKVITQPIVEMPASPEPECSQPSEIIDIEDAFNEESCEIPTIKLNVEEFTLNLQNYMEQNMELQEGEMSKALVAIHPDAARIPTTKLKYKTNLRTEHYVYELPDSHPLLNGWEQREPDDPGKYLLAIWTPGETADSIHPPERKCSSQDCGQLCKENECFACNSVREANSQIVRGTILIPCRTAMRGTFPLNGTYFQVNEVFADNDSSINPISVPRSWIWNLRRRTVYFGTSVTNIFRDLSTQEIQQCFWRGYVCVRGFDRERRAPRPLLARLHIPASKKPKNPKNKDNTKKKSTPAKQSKKKQKQP